MRHLFKGPPFQILQAWKDGIVQLVLSPEILEEYRRVGEILAIEHPQINFTPVLEFVIKNAVVFSAPQLPERVCDDPDDDKFLACALASGCNLVVSGDKHLLAASGYMEVVVLKLREFVDNHL